MCRRGCKNTKCDIQQLKTYDNIIHKESVLSVARCYSKCGECDKEFTTKQQKVDNRKEIIKTREMYDMKKRVTL